MLRKIFMRFFDYEIIGEYFETDDKGHLHKKYLKKYHLRKR